VGGYLVWFGGMAVFCLFGCPGGSLGSFRYSHYSFWRWIGQISFGALIKFGLLSAYLVWVLRFMELGPTRLFFAAFVASWELPAQPTFPSTACVETGGCRLLEFFLLRTCAVATNLDALK